MFESELHQHIVIQLFGAVTAGLVGVVTALFLEWRKDLREYKLHRNLVWLDLKRIHRELNDIKSSLGKTEYGIRGARYLSALPTLTKWELIKQSQTALRLHVGKLDRLQRFLVGLNELRDQYVHQYDRALVAIWWAIFENNVKEYTALAEGVRRELQKR